MNQTINVCWHEKYRAYLWKYSVGLYAKVFWQCPAHDDVIKWRHYPRYWPFVRGIHQPPVNSAHKGQWHGALMFSLICAWINYWVNYREAGDLRRHRVHYDVTVMTRKLFVWCVRFGTRYAFGTGINCHFKNLFTLNNILSMHELLA